MTTPVTLPSILVLALAAAPLAAQGPVPRPLTPLDQEPTPFPLFTEYTPDLATDGSSVTAVWSVDAASGRQEVRAATSDDAGRSWSTSVVVVPDAPPAQVALELGNGVRRAGDRLYAPFRRAATAGFGVPYRAYLASSADGGATWAQVGGALPTGHPAIDDVRELDFEIVPGAVADELFLLSLGADSTNGTGRNLALLRSTDGGASWSTTSVFDPQSSGGPMTASMTLDGGAVHVFYAEDVDSQTQGHDTWYRRLAPGASTFDPPVQLDVTDTLGQASVSTLPARHAMAVDGPDVAVAWVEYRALFDLDLRFASSSDGGLTFSADRVIPMSTPSTDAELVRSAYAQGALLLLWKDAGDALRVLRSTDNGATFAMAPAFGLSGIQRTELEVDDATVAISAVQGFFGPFLDTWASFAVTSEDAGVTWSAPVEILASSEGLTSASAEATALQPGTKNLYTTFAAADAPGGTELLASGFAFGTTATATVRNAGANPPSLSATNAPALGRNWSSVVDLSTTGHGFAVLAAYRTPANLPLAGGQTLLANVGDPGGELLGAPLAAGPSAVFSLPVPNDPGLAGYALTAQAVHVGGVTPFALSNALDLTIGTEQ